MGRIRHAFFRDCLLQQAGTSRSLRIQMPVKMHQRRIKCSYSACFLASVLLLMHFFAGAALGSDLREVRARGVLRHLGLPYANFVTGGGDGLDVEMVKLFAEYLGVKYQFVGTAWEEIVSDLSGKRVVPSGDDVEIQGEAPVRGDIAACGLTILPWREKVVSFSTPTFPNQVWLVARKDSRLRPIQPSGGRDKDIELVKAQLEGISLLGASGTCLDPQLYGLDEAGAQIVKSRGVVNELLPAIMKGEAEATILDACEALLALEKWPGEFKVIGPVSPMQVMGYAFAKSSPELRAAFNRFFDRSRRDGTYRRLVVKYYSLIIDNYPEFFNED